MRLRRIIQGRRVIDLVEWALRRGGGLSTARLRLLPDFILIGAQRSGTTSFFKHLCQHPEVHASFPKEVHFFTNNYHKGLNWYRSHFPLATWKIKAERDGKQKFITGEATPYYLAHPHAPQRASQVVPNALLIVLLRNPIDRAYSHYQHEVRMGVESLSFDEALDKEEERLLHESEKMAQDEHYCSFPHQHYSYLARGVYIDQILAWKRYFSSEAMLILASELFYAEPSTTIRRVTDKFGLANWCLDNAKKYHVSSYSQMSTGTRSRLAAYFRPHNLRLFETLNLDFDWEV